VETKVIPFRQSEERARLGTSWKVLTDGARNYRDPASPAGRIMMGVVGSSWSSRSSGCVGELDIVATANGRSYSSGQIKVISPWNRVVKKIMVTTALM